MSSMDFKMPSGDEQDDCSYRYKKARGWLISAAVENVLDHCSETDRERLNLITAAEVQDPEAMIPEFNEETIQYADLIVQQAIATISILISKKYAITILKQEI